MNHLSFLQAIVIGLVQGITELFPVSSLGHSVLVPARLGGSWQSLVTQESSPESPYLAFIVGLHVATALALLIVFRRDWIAIIGGFFNSIRHRRIETVPERLAWLIIIATIPVGIAGLLLEHLLRTVFAKPLAAAFFLTLNGLILFAGERLRRRVPGAVEADEQGADTDDDIVHKVRPFDAAWVGTLQITALFAGISRSGVTMVGGLLRGLSHEEAVRFSFLLATPVIFAAGMYKVPDLFGPLGNGIRPQVIVGSLAAFGASYFAATFLVRWFKTRTLIPFAVYCLVFGLASVVRFS